MSWIERFRRAWGSRHIGPPRRPARATEAPARPQRSRFRVESKDGRTRLIDLRTGEDLSAYCVKVEFVHDASDGKGYPALRITLRDNWHPEALIERTAE